MVISHVLTRVASGRELTGYIFITVFKVFSNFLFYIVDNFLDIVCRNFIINI